MRKGRVEDRFHQQFSGALPGFASAVCAAINVTRVAQNDSR
jgi:hypothetical protein